MEATSPVLEAALAAHEAGLSVVRAMEDGSKRPAGQWKALQAKRSDISDLQAWFGSGATGIGLVCGRISGGLEMLEFEGRAVDEGVLDTFRAACEDAGSGDAWSKVEAGYSELTPSGGVHYLYRCDEVEGNLKLARRRATEEELAANADDKIKVLIETRGEGGFVVVAPSHGKVHPSGRPWELLSGGFETIAAITPDERRSLLAVAREFDQTATHGQSERLPARTVRPASTAGRTDVERLLRGVSDDWMQAVIDDFNRRVDWDHGDVLPDYQLHHESDGVTYLTRPGKEKRDGHSATVKFRDSQRSVIFFSSAIEDGFEIYDGAGRAPTYDFFSIYAIRHHGSDRVAAARQLRDEGYGPQTATATKTSASTPMATSSAGLPEADASPDEPSSWQPRVLGPVIEGIRDGTISQPTPTVGRRTDGPGIFYPGRVNAINGESGHGKSWVALHACGQEIEAGNHVVFIDFEDNDVNIANRLLTLGVPGGQIVYQFHYIRPDARLTAGDQQKLRQLIETTAATLVVIDSTGESLSVEGLEDKDGDVSRWFRILPRYLADLGPAVVIIDHVTKSTETRGLYAIGSQRKRAAITGTAFMVDSVRPGGKGLYGISKLTTAKDRSGCYPQGKQAAQFHYDDTMTVATGRMAVKLVPPVETSQAGDGQTFRPTIYMERVSKYLEGLEPGVTVSKNLVEQTVGGQAKTVRQALEVLVIEDYVGQKKDGQAYKHWSNRPYRAADDHRTSVEEAA